MGRELSFSPAVSGCVSRTREDPPPTNEAVVRPLIKIKLSLDKDILTICHQASCLTQLSRALEKILASGLTDHFAEQRLDNDVRRKGTVLIFIDFSEAFNTVDHHVVA